MSSIEEPHLALLRGINVGGKNIVKMEELRKCCQDLGLTDVKTYIASGNLMFRTKASRLDLERRLEAELTKRFSYTARIVILSLEEYRAALAAAPPTWGKVADQKHNALFTLAEVSPHEVLAALPPLEDRCEAVTAGPGALFWSASNTEFKHSQMAKFLAGPVGKSLTVRNHRTSLKLLTMLEQL